MRVSALLLCALMVASCQAGPPTVLEAVSGPALDPPQSSECGADSLAGLVGQPASAVPSRGVWGTVRVVSMGMMVTQDYSATRLNVHLDRAGKILAFDCG